MEKKFVAFLMDDCPEISILYCDGGGLKIMLDIRCALKFLTAIEIWFV